MPGRPADGRRARRGAGIRRVVVAGRRGRRGRARRGRRGHAGVETLADAVELVRSPRVAPAPSPAPPRVELVDAGRRGTAGARRRPARRPATRRIPDLAEVRGQAEARRGLEIALAGGHGLLLIGPPGSGKTLLARTIPGLLPPLDDAAALAATIVASAAGEGPIDASSSAGRRSGRRTTRSPTPAMVGGGPRLSPGEVTLADQGVLFLDELPEFDRDVLEALRQPLEEGRVAIARAGRATTFPARFQLVAAMNPCPCGFAGLADRRLRAARRRRRSATSGASRVRSATGSTCGSTMPRVAPTAHRRRPGAGGARPSSRRGSPRPGPSRPARGRAGRRSTAG